jgi:hypothetical protein
VDDPDGWNAWGTVAPVETAQSSAIGALHAAMCALCRFCRCLWCAHAIWLGVAGRASPDEPAQGAGPANGVDHFAISVNPAPERTSTDTWGAADSSWDGDDGWDDGDGARRSSALSALSAVSKPLCTAHTVADCRSGGRWPGMGRQLGFPTKSQIRRTAAAAADIAERHSQDAEDYTSTIATIFGMLPFVSVPRCNVRLNHTRAKPRADNCCDTAAHTAAADSSVAAIVTR